MITGTCRPHGVRFAEAPRKERYGRVVVFYDLYGNKWDLGAAKRGMTPAIAHGGAVTNIVIQPLTVTNQADLNRCDNSFTVQAELSLAATDGRISYTVRPVAPHIKHYAPEVYDVQAYTLAPAHTDRCSAGVEKPDRAAWLAYVDGALAGQILIHENWNRFALIWDIAVDPPFRRRGVGRRLIAQAVAWARDRVLPGMMLETQSINVAACPLYASCGFVLGGFDACLYRGVMPGTREIALLWYLLF